MLHIRKTKSGYRVTTDNTVYIGDFLQGDDGYYAFWPNIQLSGCWPQTTLHELSTKLLELNKEWNETVQKTTQRNPH